MIELVSAIHREMLRFAPQYVGEPAKCVYRIYRDTRFSKDKTPYKTYASALFLRNGFSKYAGGAAYYFAVSPEDIEVAGGVYTPDRDVLLAVRQHIADNHKQFRATFGRDKVKKLLGELQGESSHADAERLRPGSSGGGPDPAQAISSRYPAGSETGHDAETARGNRDADRGHDAFRRVSQSPACRAGRRNKNATKSFCDRV